MGNVRPFAGLSGAIRRRTGDEDRRGSHLIIAGPGNSGERARGRRLARKFMAVREVPVRRANLSRDTGRVPVIFLRNSPLPDPRRNASFNLLSPRRGWKPRRVPFQRVRIR